MSSPNANLVIKQELAEELSLNEDVLDIKMEIDPFDDINDDAYVWTSHNDSKDSTRKAEQLDYVETTNDDSSCSTGTQNGKTVIDVGKFIFEMECRPMIWNVKSKDFYNKDVKQQGWDELVTIFFDKPNASKQELHEFSVTLQKKWKNIRDCFVKAHKAKETKSGSAAKKKVPYVFYNNLLFLKDAISVNTTTSNVTTTTSNVTTQVNKTNEDAQNDVTPNSSWTPKRNKKNNDDHIGRELIGVLNRNLENKKCEDDDGDRLFCLSLVKEFKKIPEHLRIQTKLDILKVIRDAQVPNYPNTSWDHARPNNSYREYQTAQHSRSHPYSLPVQSYETGRVIPQEPVVSPVQVQSALSVDSAAT